MITATIQGQVIHMFIGSTMAPVCTGADCRYCKWNREQEASK